MNRIRELREEKNITQVRLSIELGVSQETISAYEMNKHYPSIKALLKLKDIFGVSIDYIMGLSDIRYPACVHNLSEQEKKMLSLFKQLDYTGKEKLLAYAEGYLAGNARH